MERLAIATAAHVDVLGPALAAEFAAFPGAYAALRNAQLGKNGEVSNNKVAAANMRDEVEQQLWNNVHYLAWYYKGAVEKCMAYFNQSMLR